MNQIKIS